MKRPIYLVVGVPASGKSWVCDQLKSKFDYIRHDDYMDTKLYVDAIRRLLHDDPRPMLIETPFSMSQILQPLQGYACEITPVFIIEDEKTLRDRYNVRGTGDYPKGHLTRQETYFKRAVIGRYFYGTSQQVLERLLTYL